MGDQGVTGSLVLTAVIAVATVVYTIATILLWKTTKASLDQSRESLRAMTKATHGLTLQGIAENHRAIAFKALDSRKLRDTFMSGNPVDHELDAETRLFAGVLINHFETCFEHCRFRTIPDEFKEPLLRDIARSFRSIPALRRRWSEVHLHLESEFVKFVDAELKEEKNESHSHKIS